MVRPTPGAIEGVEDGRVRVSSRSEQQTLGPPSWIGRGRWRIGRVVGSVSSGAAFGGGGGGTWDTGSEAATACAGEARAAESGSDLGGAFHGGWAEFAVDVFREAHGGGQADGLAWEYRPLGGGSFPAVRFCV